MLSIQNQNVLMPSNDSVTQKTSKAKPWQPVTSKSLKAKAEPTAMQKKVKTKPT